MKFEGMIFADISTSYLEEPDLKLIQDQAAPNHLANHDHGFAAFFWVPSTLEEWTQFDEAAKQFGFSRRFIEIMKELYNRKIPRVCFDASGGDIEGLDPLQK
jgi:hypothetical protein